MTDDQPIRLLFVEDVLYDVELAERALRKEGLAFTTARVETRDDFLTALTDFQPDLIVSDYSMPEFDGMEALRLSLAHDPTLPFIVLTGSLNEETAVACIKAGATDYILKDRIARLPFAVREALAQKQARQAREAAERALRESEERYRTILENTPVGFFQSTPEGRYLRVNPAMARILGYDSPEDMLSTVTDIATQVHGDPARREEFKRLLAERSEVIEFVNQNRRKDGSRIFTSTNARVVSDEHGQLLYYEGFMIDITERKQAEEALRVSEEKYRKLFSEMFTGAALHQIVCDAEGRAVDYITLEVNHAFEVMLNAPREAVIGQRASAILPADELAHWLEVFGPVALTGQSTRYELYSALNNKYFEGSAYCPALGQFAVTFYDVTERKRAEEALRDSVRRERERAAELQTIMDVVPASILIAHDQMCWLVTGNRAAYDARGYPLDSNLSATAPDNPNKPPFKVRQNGLQIAPADFALQVAAATGVEIRDMEHELIFDDGRVTYELANVVPVLDETGRPRGAVGAFIDITERKQRERELEAIALTATALRAAPTRAEMLPVIVHQAYNLLRADSAALITLDPATGEAVVAFGQGDAAGQTGRRIPPGADAISRVIATGRPCLLNAADQEPAPSQPDLLGYMHAIAGVPLIAQNQTIGALWVGRQTAIDDEEVRRLTAIGDIAANALQRAELLETLERRVIDRTRELAVANERLKELDQLKSKFVSDVSHELRTPVTSLSLYVDLLQTGKPEKHDLYLSRLKQQTARLRMMIDEILDLSRLERDRDQGGLAAIDLNSIAEHVVAAQQAAAEEAGLQLTCEVAEQTPLVMGQPDQLNRVLTNLVANAIKYTPAGWVRVQVHNEHARCRVDVADSGIGVLPEDVPHLFERFYRGRQVSQSNIPGTGLGLAIVKEIIEAHGGTVEVDSQPGAGSTFKLWLPTVNDPAAMNTL